MNLTKNNNRSQSMDSFFENLFNNNLTDFIGSDFHLSQPSVNILETADDYKIEMAAPGLTKEQFDIHLEENLLTISLKKEENTEDVRPKYTRREFNYSSFKRSFTLPDTIDNQSIAATYDNGVLHLSLPKREEAKPLPARKIEIK